MGVLAIFGVGHDLGEALGQPVIGKGEGSETAEQGNGKDAHGSSLASFHRRDYRNGHRVGYWRRSTKARAADRREPRVRCPSPRRQPHPDTTRPAPAVTTTPIT